MTYFDTNVDARKTRVPTPPKVFQRLGYDNWRYPFVVNFFTLEAYGVYIQRKYKAYAVVTDGWKFFDELAECKFGEIGVYEVSLHGTYLDAVDKFSDVCSFLCKAWRFDFIKESYYQICREHAERIAYEQHPPEVAEKIILDRFGEKELFDELP